MDFRKYFPKDTFYFNISNRANLRSSCFWPIPLKNTVAFLFTPSPVIFKNKYYNGSTNFTLDEDELKKDNLKYGQNKRSKNHLEIFGKKSFDKTFHKKYLSHEKIENLIGLEVECIYEWEIGSILIFDRSHLHASSSQLEGKKIGLTTFTKK